MYDNVGRQFLQCLEVMPKRLFDEVTFLNTGRANVAFEQLTGRA